jgi:SH3-like domain-containing protein
MALEYRSVAAPAILYDAPSDQGKKLYIIARNTPVEVVVGLDKWVKVRDMGGGLAWIERGRLSEHRSLQVSAARAAVRQKPEEAAPVVFEAARDVVLELAEPPAAGWVKVRHRDGLSGYVRVADVWGL